MVLSLAFILGIAQILQLSYSDCVYTDSGQTMYLTQLAHSVLTYNNTDENYIYTFTPCRNAAAVCDNNNGGSDTSMCSQTQGDECKVIANWDASATATFSAQTGPGRWSITYYGNPCDGGGDIKMDATFLCNETAADYQVITACVC